MWLRVAGACWREVAVGWEQPAGVRGGPWVWSQPLDLTVTSIKFYLDELKFIFWVCQKLSSFCFFHTVYSAFLLDFWNL